MAARAAEFGLNVTDDGFIFSLEPNCCKPMPPDYVTRRVAVLKDHLGIVAK